MSKAKRQTREQRADALLESARAWQWGNSYLSWLLGGQLDPDVVLSAALSEVAGLGFELENADGTPTEKVAIMTFNVGVYSGLAWRSYLCDGIVRR